MAKKDDTARNDSVEMHPDDKAMRAEGIVYGKKYAEEFVREHMTAMIALIGTYADARAESDLGVLRELFWARDWVPKG